MGRSRPCRCSSSSGRRPVGILRCRRRAGCAGTGPRASRGRSSKRELTPDLLARDIGGTDYRDLTVRVQADILSDDRFTVVRILASGRRPHLLDRAEDDAGVIAGDDQWIAQALEGQTVSVLSSADTYHDGLKRPNEETFQTFVPIRSSIDSLIDGVVQIDQRYSAIRNQAYRVWRPVQFIALALLVAIGVQFVGWLGNAAVTVEPAPGRAPSDPGRRADDVQVRDAMERADRSELLARESRSGWRTSKPWWRRRRAPRRRPPPSRSST